MWLAGRYLRRRRRPELRGPPPGSQPATGEDSNNGARYQPMGSPSGIFCMRAESMSRSSRTSTPEISAPNGSPLTGYANSTTASSCWGAPSICRGSKMSDPSCRKRRPRTVAGDPRPTAILRTTSSSSSWISCTGTAAPSCAKRRVFSSENSPRRTPESGFSVLSSLLVALSIMFTLNGPRTMTILSVFTPASSNPSTETSAVEKLPAYIISPGLLSTATCGVFWSPSWSCKIRPTSDPIIGGRMVEGASTMRSTISRTNSVFLDTALGGGSVLQIGVDKGVEVTVEDAIDVRRLLAGAVVLHQLVRVEDVGPYLGAPLDIRLLPALRSDLLLAPLALELEEARPENAHRDLTVLVLAALVLALH